MRMVRIFGVVLAACALLVGAAASSAGAAAGDLDTAFGNGGRVTYSFGAMGDIIHGLDLLGDGRIVAGGMAYDDGDATYGFGIARFGVGGALDPTFGEGGAAHLILANNVFPDAMVRDAAGGYVLAGSGSSDVYFTRFNADGTHDTPYGGGGTGFFSRDWGSGSDNVNALAPLADGAVIAAGSVQNVSLDGEIASYTSGGANNSIFSGSPTKTVALDASYGDSFAAAATLPDGRILLAGYVSHDGLANRPVVVRLTAAGGYDASWGTGGVAEIPTVDGYLSALSVNTDGSVVAAGGAGPDSIVAKFTSGGVLDGSFGSGGVANIGIPGADSANAVVAYPGGRYVVGGIAGAYGAASDFLVERINANGSLDTTFGGTGQVTTDFSGRRDFVNALVVRPNGNIVAGGASAPSIQTDDFALAEYQGTTPAPALVARSKITSPSSRRLARKKFKSIAGTAGPAGSVANVEVAIRRIDGRQLWHKRCLWVRSSSGRIKKVKDRTRKCAKPVWIKARGTTKWSFKLKKRLGAGSYRLYSRATLTSGATETRFTTKSGNLRKLTLKRK